MQSLACKGCLCFLSFFSLDKNLAVLLVPALIVAYWQNKDLAVSSRLDHELLACHEGSQLKSGGTKNEDSQS